MSRRPFRLVPVAIVVLLALVPLTGEFRGLVGSLAVIFALVALGFVVLTGWTGDVSLGQIVPYGLGAYGTFFLIDKAHFPVTLAILGAAVLAAPAVLLIGIPALRLRGLDLAIATFALALIAQLAIFKNLGRVLEPDNKGLTEFSSSVVRVERPSIGPLEIDTNVRFYVFALVLATVVFLVVVAIGRSSFGRSLLAVRDDPVRAEVLGLSVPRYRLAAFLIAGTIAAFAGALSASLRQAVTPETFTIFESLNFLAMAVIGGLASPAGAVLGGIFGAVLPEIARQDPFRFLQGRLILVYGLALIGILAFKPGGLSAAFGWDRRRASRMAPAGARKEPVERGLRPRRSLLRVDDLVVTFGGVRAVDEVGIRVADGESVAMIGPNGAGKSTLFDAITGLLQPARGRVYFDGTDITAMPPHRRALLGMARTFQTARVFPTLTVLENLLAAGPATRAPRLLDRLGLADAAESLPSALSYGGLRRLEVGLALAGEPRLLLLDEPTAGMDREEAEQLCGLLDDLRNELGFALLLVEHDMAVVGRLAQRVIVLDQGRAIADGTPRQVAHDANVIAAYLGTSAELLRPSAASAGARAAPAAGRRTHA